jgi:hypothetical protein
VAGYGLTYNNISHKIQVAGLTADDISNGVNNKFFSTELAQDAAASLFTTGSHTNISFAYDDTLGKLNATVALDGIGLTDIVNDTSPSLGGNLDLNSHDITGTGNINTTGDITASSDITALGALSGLSIGATTAVITSATVTSLSSAEINVPDSSLGIEIVSKIGNSFAIGYYNGTFENKLPVPKNNGGMVMSLKGWNGTEYALAGGVGALFETGATLTDAAPKSTVALISGAGSDVNNYALFDSAGVLSVPVLKVSNVAGTLPSSPQAGMIVLDGTTFKGYNGSAWVNLN